MRLGFYAFFHRKDLRLLEAMKLKLITALCVAFASGAPFSPPTTYTNPLSGACLDFGEAAKYNGLFFDSYEGSSDVQGRIAVAGDAKFASGFSVGDQLQDAKQCAEAVCVIGGSLEWPRGRNYFGNVIVGKTSHKIAPGVLENGCKVEVKAGALDFAAMKTKLIALSKKLDGMTATLKSADVDDKRAVKLVFSGAADIEVMNVDKADYFGNVIKEISSIQGVRPGALIVFNIKGAKASIADVHLEALANYNVVFNFAEATDLSLHGAAIRGSVLAVNAKITNGQGVVWGHVYARSMTGPIQINLKPIKQCESTNVIKCRLRPKPTSTPCDEETVKPTVVPISTPCDEETVKPTTAAPKTTPCDEETVKPTVVPVSTPCDEETVKPTTAAPKTTPCDEETVKPTSTTQAVKPTNPPEDDDDCEEEEDPVTSTEKVKPTSAAPESTPCDEETVKPTTAAPKTTPCDEETVKPTSAAPKTTPCDEETVKPTSAAPTSTSQVVKPTNPPDDDEDCEDEDEPTSSTQVVKPTTPVDDCEEVEIEVEECDEDEPTSTSQVVKPTNTPEDDCDEEKPKDDGYKPKDEDKDDSYKPKDDDKNDSYKPKDDDQDDGDYKPSEPEKTPCPENVKPTAVSSSAIVKPTEISEPYRPPSSSTQQVKPTSAAPKTTENAYKPRETSSAATVKPTSAAKKTTENAYKPKETNTDAYKPKASSSARVAPTNNAYRPRN